MKCFRCGSEIPERTRFCGNCGTLVTDPHAATVVVEGGPESELERVRMVLAGEFSVEREVARGGMGVIYEARDAALGRRVALKVLAPNLAIATRSAERFKREARTVADLEHPNIVPVYRVGEIGGILFIAMKYVEGRPLDDVIKEQGAFSAAMTLYVLRAATRALAYAHDRGIVHRDVKGGNLLVDRDGRILVSDFGVALRATDVTLTQDGSMIGTPAFMSPEQCSGKRATPQSDQYSLGVVAFEMLAGAVPFDSDTLAGYIRHHLYTPPPDLRQARDDLPEPFLRIIQRAMEKEPDRRFATTRDMLEAIEALPFSETERRECENQLRDLARGRSLARVHTRSLPALSEVPTQMLAAVHRTRRLWTRMAWAAGGIAVLAAGGVLLTRGRQDAGAARPTTPAPPETIRVPVPAADTSPARAPAPAPPTAPMRNGTLRLLTVPASAEILVDGKAVGVGSLFDLAIPAGSRRLQIRAPGYAPYDTILTMAADRAINLGRIVLQPRSGDT